MSKLFGSKHKREQLREHRGRAFLDDKCDTSSIANVLYNSMKSYKQKLLDPEYCQELDRKRLISTANRVSKNKPISLPTVSIQDD